MQIISSNVPECGAISPERKKNIEMGSDIPEKEWIAISRNVQIMSNGEQSDIPEHKWGPVMISLDANEE